MGERHIERHLQEKANSPKELTFNQLLDSISRAEMIRRIQELAQEERLTGTNHKFVDSKPAKEHSIDFGQTAAFKSGPAGTSDRTNAKATDLPASVPGVKFDEATNSYQTDDGYILPLGGPRIERLSGYVLQDQLKQIAFAEELNASKGSHSPIVRSDNSDALVSLPGSAINYGAMANGLNARNLYASPSTSCSETSVSIDGHVAGIAGGSLTIYDKQNDECRLAQTVAQSCAITELLALDVQNAGSVPDMLRRSDAVVTASDYCAETIDAVKKEEQRLQKEEEE